MNIELRGLAKSYDNDRGLKPLTLTVQPGEFVAVVGHNGAGKSTLLKLLAGWLRPDAGDALIGGTSISQRRRVVQRLGFVPETPNLYEHFSVTYNLRLFARLHGLPLARVDAVLAEFELQKYAKASVESLSKGLRQRVSLSRSLLADPPVMLFDEPTSGLDFDSVKEVYHRLKTVHGAGKTILFTSHRPEEVKLFATRIIVLHGGALTYDGTPAGCLESSSYRDLY